MGKFRTSCCATITAAEDGAMSPLRRSGTEGSSSPYGSTRMARSWCWRDALYVSTDNLKSFQRFAMPGGDKRLFLHPFDIYPAYLSVQEGEDRYVVYRLDK